MRAARAKLPKTNTLTAIKLKRGFATLPSGFRQKSRPWHSKEQSLEEALRVGEGGEVSPESSACRTMSGCVLLEHLRRYQNEGILGTRGAKACNLPLKESARTFETSWSKAAPCPPPDSPPLAHSCKASLPAVCSTPPDMQL